MKTSAKIETNANAPEPTDEAPSFSTLELRDAVRKRPAMYVGSRGSRGIYNLFIELLDSLVDENSPHAGNCIRVVLSPDNIISVTSEGFCFSTAKSSEKNACYPELLLMGQAVPFGFTSKLQRRQYNYTCANFLAEWLHLKIQQNDESYEQDFQHGLPEAPQHLRGKLKGKSGPTQMTITLKPDPTIFEAAEFSFDQLRLHLELKAYLTKSLRFELTDARSEPVQIVETTAPEGLASFVTRLGCFENLRNAAPISFSQTDAENKIRFEVALQYSWSANTQVHSFANQQKTYEGGTHVDGLLTGLLQALHHYQNGEYFEDIALTEKDVLPGLIAVISVYLPVPQFEGSSEQKLVSPVQEFISSSVTEFLSAYFESQPDIAREISSKVFHNYREQHPEEDDCDDS